MYCIGKNGVIILICLKFKADVAKDEAAFQVETTGRLGEFLKNGTVT